MITVMQGILNVKLKSRVKAENVVRISGETLKNTECHGCVCKKIRNDRNKIHANRSVERAKRVHAIAEFAQTCARCGGLHGSSWRGAGSQSRAQRRRGKRVVRDVSH